MGVPVEGLVCESKQCVLPPNMDREREEVWNVFAGTEEELAVTGSELMAGKSLSLHCIDLP
jgi:hypothetical protein